MSNSNETIHEEINCALRNHSAEYAEIRLEESESTYIQYRGRELEDIGTSTARGGNVRALTKGGWGFISFNELGKLSDKVELATRQARVVGKETSFFAVTNPARDIVIASMKKDPSSLSLASKKSLLDEYNEIIWETPRIQTSSITYREGSRRIIFANSEGSYLEQEVVDLTLRVNAVARDGNEVQQAGISIGGRGDFGVVEGLHKQVKEIAQRAVDMLSAPKAKSGECTIILDPILAGVFVHEAFGHLSESDFVYENERLKEIMVLGRRFGGKHLNIVDDATLPNLRGSYQYDDEGTLSTRNYLVREGVLVGRLHSRETAARMQESPTGNARALSYRYPPIVRMSNTFIECGEASFEEMLSEVKEGIYAKNWYGGTTAMEMFTFSAGEAYMIRNGKVAEPLRPVILSGNVFTTLSNIDAVGNDLEMNQGGGCGKGGQSPLPVSNGSPHIRIRCCLVGGG